MVKTDIKTGRDLQEKTPDENYPFDFVFTNLKDGETITSVIEIIETKRDTVTGSVALTQTNITHDGLSTGQAWFAGGTSLEYYCLKMRVNTSIGAVRSCTGVLFVREPC